MADGGCHRNGTNACTTDEGINLLFQEEVHNLCHQDTTSTTNAKGNDADTKDGDGLEVEEGACCSSCTNGNTQHDDYDVIQLVLCCLAQTFNDTALLEEVAEHQAADKCTSRWNYQANDDGHNDGEDNLLLLADCAKLAHANHAFFLRGEGAHDGRLNDRHQSHIAISSYSNGTKQLRSKLGRQEDSGRTICATDDTDGSGLSYRETEDVNLRYQEGCEDAKLSSSTKQEALGIGNQRTEVGHCTYAKEDEARINASLHTHIKDVEQTSMSHNVAVAVIVRAVGIEELVVPHIRVEETSARQIAENHAESDGQEQQGLVLFLDGKIKEEAADKYHDGILPTFFLHKEGDKAHLVDELAHTLFQVEVSSQKRCCNKEKQEDPSQPPHRGKETFPKDI